MDVPDDERLRRPCPLDDALYPYAQQHPHDQSRNHHRGRTLMRQRSGGHLLCWIAFAFVGCVLRSNDAAAQSPSSGPLTLTGAVELALANYPAIKESRARAQAAVEAVGVERT